MISIGLIFGACLFLAFANGANDNFKGVATLLGSRTAQYKTALLWATLTTFLGSLTALFLAQELLINFSGKGLVPDSIVAMESFSASVALSAAITVFLATKLGFPISTTHALTGALVGAGFMASTAGVNLGKLISSFFLPLISSPFLAISAAAGIYPLFTYIRKKSGVNRETCLCLGNEVVATGTHGLPSGAFATATIQIDTQPKVIFGTQLKCEERYVGNFWGISAKKILDVSHFLSAGLVGFARGLNDTPKIAAVLLVGGSLSAVPAIFFVGIAIALGGVLMAKRVAKTMSFEITKMNDGQGFTANIITSIIVIGASQMGLPVSTTHVSCGALFGIGTITKQAKWKSIAKIILSWLITLPVAGTLGYMIFAAIKGMG